VATLWASVKAQPTTTSFSGSGVTLRLPLLRPDQSAIARHPARIKVVVIGRRWGKTVLGGSVSLACASQGAQVAWIVPTYKQGRPLWRWSEMLVAPLRAHRMVKINRADRLIEFASGGFLGVYSADSPDSIRGNAFDLVVGDEAARITEDTWQAVIQPTLADRNGRAILISTPRGRDWFFREYTRGKELNNAEQACWNAPTAGNPNPQIQAAYHQAKTRISERTFRQEWDAEFVNWEGQVFRLVEDLSVVDIIDGARVGHEYVAGIDWGKLNDYTVLSVIDVTTKEQVYIDRFNSVDYSIQLNRLEGAHQKFKFRKIYAESNAMGEPLIEQCYRKGMPIEGLATTNATKALWVDHLSLAMETQKIKLLDHDIQKNELVNFEGTRLPSGLTRYAAPEGQFDDCVMALLLANEAATIPEAAGSTMTQNVDVSHYSSQRQTRTGLTMTRRQR